MKFFAFSLLAIASFAKGDIAGLRSTNAAATAQESTSQGTLLVDYLYTYGAPATAKHPHHANPGNRCIPGVRVYSENVNSWGHITNTDFAAHINAARDYGHPKISTLILRWVDDGSKKGKQEYMWFECKDSDNTDYYKWEWYPGKWNAANMIPGYHIHSLDTVYEPRLKSLLDDSSHQLGNAKASGLALDPRVLDYTSVAWCNGMAFEATKTCLKNYATYRNKKDVLAHPYAKGINTDEWKVDAQLEHTTESGFGGSDTDRVYTLRNDNDPAIGRKCIISFQQSRSLADFGSFTQAYTTGFCGRYGVHAGVRDELWHLISDPQWAAKIKPSLEQCDQVTCVGHSLGGALCNVFTMCANTGHEYLAGNTDSGMQNDYDMLTWTKKTGAAKEQGADVDAASE